MSFRFHLVVNFLNPARGIDHEGGALDAHHFPAVQILFLVDAVGFGGCFLGIGKEDEGKAEVVLCAG